MTFWVGGQLDSGCCRTGRVRDVWWTICRARLRSLVRVKLPFGVAVVGAQGIGNVVSNASVLRAGRIEFLYGVVVLGHLAALADLTVVGRLGKGREGQGVAPRSQAVAPSADGYVQGPHTNGLGRW